jgi:hypothetical protein
MGRGLLLWLLRCSDSGNHPAVAFLSLNLRSVRFGSSESEKALLPFEHVAPRETGPAVLFV